VRVKESPFPFYRSFAQILLCLLNVNLELRRSRDHVWTVVKSRRHELAKVYVCNDQADDLLLIGKVDMVFRNGREVSEEFVGRVVVTEGNTESARVKLYQVWSVSFMRGSED
jgi:hypothetical protein